MPRRLDWNAAALLMDSPYRAALYHRPAALGDLAPPSLDHLDDALAQRRAYAKEYIDRAALVESLRRSHQRRGAPPPVLDAIERLRDENAFLVIAGQQPGLLGGPLLTWYKALHAVALARRLSEQRGELFLPAFWNASEDHDPGEINTVTWLSKNRSLETFAWEISNSKRPYFAIPSSEIPVEALRQRILETTHPSDFRDEILDSMRSSVAQAETYPDCFDRWMWSRLGDEGLIILRPDDDYARRSAAPLIQREIDDPTRSSQSIQTCASILEKAGFSAQIHKREDRAAFFLLRDCRREPVYFRDGIFALDTGDPYTGDQLGDLLGRDPTLFSPSAILRPAIQDACFPTAAVILGPSELAYHFLLRDIYQAHGVPRPSAVPRFGFTILESRDLKSIEKYEIRLPDLREDPAALIKQWMRARGSGVDVAPLENTVSGFFETLKARAQTIDPTIIPSLDKNLQGVLKRMRDSEALLVRREAERNQAARAQIESLQDALLPKGHPQERVLSILHYGIKYGPGFLRVLADLSMDIEDGAHVFAQVP